MAAKPEGAEEFKFPDEQAGVPVVQESDEKVQVELLEDAAPEIEVIDDTPEQDRGRKPLPYAPEEVTDEEMEKYSSDVQKRIRELTHQRHDERRAKEQIQREREELVRAAQALVEENKRLKGYINVGETEYGKTLKEAAQAQLDTAKRKYKAALDEYDSEAILAAQQELTQAQLRLMQAQNFRPSMPTPPQGPLQNQTNAVYQQPTEQAVPNQPDERLLRWQQKNQWFGDDEEMTALALAYDTKLQREGIGPDHPKYYERIDARVREKFPEHFGEPKAKPRSANVVAPATQAGNTRKVPLTQTQVALAKRMGLPLEEYAKSVLQLEIANGQR